MDVLTIIIYINGRSGETSLPTAPAGTHPFYDADDDDAVTPLDVLQVIHDIDSRASGPGEGEMAAATADVATLPSLIGAPRGAAVPLFPTADELWTEAASTALAKNLPLLIARPQATSPRAEARRTPIAVGSASDSHFADPLRGDHDLCELDDVLRAIALDVAKYNRSG